MGMLTGALASAANQDCLRKLGAGDALRKLLSSPDERVSAAVGASCHPIHTAIARSIPNGLTA
jgi:hypothetical protein